MRIVDERTTDVIEFVFYSRTNVAVLVGLKIEIYTRYYYFTTVELYKRMDIMKERDAWAKVL